VTATLVGGCTSGGGSAKSFCESLRTGPDVVALLGAASTGADQMSPGIERLHQLEAAAPADVKGAVGDLAAVATDLQAVLVARAQPSTGAPPATLAPTDQDKATRASATITQYASATCGIDLGGPPVPAPGS